ncbi:hypothetical protein [Archangium lipolyticum]|uniref:hypothetical protein n=1 Tax=Archangium lipolyticum TaxID=2970465 RepID=UPI00214A628C|nr:hypothetical protein [Archangium lipolyticum]
MQREKTSVIDDHTNESMPGVALRVTANAKRQNPSAPNTTYSLGRVGTSVDEGGSHTDPPDVEG